MLLSIFNSKYFYKIFKGGLLWLLVWAIIFDLFFFRSSFFYGLYPKSLAGQIEVISERFSSSAASNEIEVIIFGDSHTINGFYPKLLANQLSVNENRIFNFSIVNGEPIDFYNLYLKHEESFKSAKIVIIGVSEWQFNKKSEIYSSEKFKRYSTLSDRINHKDPDAEILLGALNGAFDHREIWKNAINDLCDGKWPPEKQDFYNNGIKPNEVNIPFEKRYKHGQSRINLWYGNGDYDISRTNEKYAVKLINTLKMNNKRILVINTPKSSLYYKIRKELKYDNNFFIYKRFIENLCLTNNVPLLFYEEPWEDIYFRDINHLN